MESAATTDRLAHEFTPIDCGGGLMICRPGEHYQVRRDGRFQAVAETLYQAMKIVDRLQTETTPCQA